MFSCAYCKSEIESDSFYCDQCGQELLLCVTCGKPGQGRFCEEEGDELVAAKLKTDVAEQKVVSNQQQQVTEQKQMPSTQPALQLINRNINLVLDIESGALLGRTTGPYAGKLGGYNAISGRHMSFQYDPLKGWTCQDLGSTNKSKYSRINTNWPGIPDMAPNTPIALEDKAFLLIANVEFTIQITGGASSEATVRL